MPAGSANDQVAPGSKHQGCLGKSTSGVSSTSPSSGRKGFMKAIDESRSKREPTCVPRRLPASPSAVARARGRIRARGGCGARGGIRTHGRLSERISHSVAQAHDATSDLEFRRRVGTAAVDQAWLLSQGTEYSYSPKAFLPQGAMCNWTLGFALRQLYRSRQTLETAPPRFPASPQSNATSEFFRLY